MLSRTAEDGDAPHDSWRTLPVPKLAMLFFAIELNLVLWMILWGSAQVLGDSAREGTWWEGRLAVRRWTVAAGFGIAALVQHWAYYAIYRRAKESAAQAKASG